MSHTAIRVWLILIIVLVFAMMVLGAAVRLTDAGLSMVDWKIIHGVIPPLNAEQWQAAFAQYKKFPDFQLRNPDLDLRGFKFIFWMEYAHRILGRAIGLVFLLPLLYFHLRAKISRAHALTLWGLFFLGALQGLLGWYMVQSGLVDAPQVSQYRLAAHLMLAVFIYSGLIFCLAQSHHQQPVAGVKFIGAVALSGLFLLLFSGALVAGTRAGYIYNTWPLMGGAFLPPQLMAMSPWWINFFENPVAIQFVHRWLAVGVIFIIATFAYKLLRADKPRAALTLFLLLGMQFILGLATLLLRVPLTLAVAHQAVALLLLGAVVFWCARSR